MKRILCTLLVMVFVMSLVITGCGTSSDKQDTTTAAAKAQNTTASQEKVTIRYWYSGNDADPNDMQVKWNQENVKLFQDANPNISVKTTLLSGEPYLTKITAENAAGNLPDVFTAWVGGRLKPFVQAGSVAALDDLIAGDAELKDSVNPSTMGGVTFDGKTYAFPLLNTTEGFFYNTELFTKFNVAVPKTYDELMNSVIVFNDNKIIPIAFGNKDPWVGIIPLQGFGDRIAGEVKVLETIDQHKGSFTDPEIVSIFQKVLDMKSAGAFSPNFAGISYDDSRAQFTSGKAAMWLAGTWENSGLYNAMGDKVGFFNFPTVEGGAGTTDGYLLNQDSAYCISAKSEQAEAAKKYLQFVFSKKRQAALAETGSILCSKNLPVDRSKINPLTNKIVDDLANAKYGITMWEIPLGNNVGGELRNAVAVILAGADVNETLAKLEKVHAGEFKN